MVSRTSKRYIARNSGIMGICLTALLLLEGGLSVAATKQLPNNLLPAAGNTGIILQRLGSRGVQTVVTALQHPQFDSSWTGSPTEILAQTRYGAVTSRDLYLWMILHQSPHTAYLYENYQKSLVPEDRKDMAEALRVEIDEFVFTNYIIPKLMPAAVPDEIYNLKHELYTLPVWQTVFLQKVVAPTLCITEADRQKYLQDHTAAIVKPERLRVRYILMKTPQTAPAEEQDKIEVTMDELRASILRGDVDFAEAARQYSQASSASRGGEIPPFRHGQLFFLFENAAKNLEPGGISPVFQGPNGFYMVQLIEVLPQEEPDLSDPEQAKLVDEGLKCQVLRAGYTIYLREMLEERRRITEMVAVWDSLEDCEMLGEVCDFSISKGNFRNAFPGVETNNLQLQTGVIASQLRTILEREAMLQEVKDLGFENDPMLERARWMAGNLIRRDAWVDQLRATLPVSEELVRKYWQDNQELFVPLALKRVTKLTLTPTNTAPLPAQTRLELDQILAKASGMPETVAITKRKVQDEERGALLYDPLERTEEAFQMMIQPDEEMNFYLNPTSTSTLESLMEQPSEAIPSLEGDPAPGLDEIPGPSDVSPDTLQSLEDRPNADATLDLQTTSPKGGAAPGMAAGGSTTDGSEDTQFVAPKSYTDTEEVETGYRASSNASALPAVRPRSGGVPVGRTAPAVAPTLTIEPTPNIRHQQPPPATSSIPYNPDWFYPRRNFTEIEKIIGDYASSDWLLSTVDLGFVYLADLPGVPRKVEKVPVGAFTRPIVAGNSAVSWYIEEARSVEQQPFDQIKTHVYDVYRAVQLDKIGARTYNEELEKADIDYKF